MFTNTDTKRRTYRINADSWTVLRDILVGTPQDFNPDLSRTWSERNGWSGWKYTGALRGREITDGYTTGQLPAGYAIDMRDSVVSYVIYSYETPIAYRRVADWNTDGTANYEWIVPEVRYSVTTSKHQGKVRTALSQLSEPVVTV